MKRFIAIDPGGTKPHAWAEFHNGDVQNVGLLPNDICDWPGYLTFTLGEWLGHDFVIEGAYTRSEHPLTLKRMSFSAGEVSGAIKALTGQEPAIIPADEWLRSLSGNGRVMPRVRYKKLLQAVLLDACGDEMLKGFTKAQLDDLASAVGLGLFWCNKIKLEAMTK